MAQLKIAVIMGGTSFERKFSLKSGQLIGENLEKAGHTVLPLDADSNLVDTLRAEKPDVAFLAMHGAGGEDGTVASLLEFLRIPYVGSRPPVCRQAWNKSDLPSVMRRSHGKDCVASWPAEVALPSIAFRDLGAAKALDLVPGRVGKGDGFPLAVKPACGGSAMGMSRVDRPGQLGEAIMGALAFDDTVLIQQWIEGVEVQIPVVGLRDGVKALAPVEIHMTSGLYDTASRDDEKSRVELYCPARPDSLSAYPARAAEVRAKLEQAALEVYEAFGCRDLARVDLMWDGENAMILDLKMCPGMMSPTSVVPLSIKESGLDMTELLDELVQIAYERGA